MPVPSLRAALAQGRFLVSAWSSLTDPILQERMARAGFDALTLDMQHGLHDERSVAAGIGVAAAFGRPCIVRVPVDGYASVSRVLDYGASAVILPMIESAADARALVAAAKYPPLGRRSFGPARATQLHGYANGGAYFASANADTMCFAMIETPESFAALDEILAVEGLDGVFIGPSDLSISLSGGTLDHDGPQVTEAIRDIAARARAAGKFTALYVFDAAEARKARANGCDLVTVSSDAAIFEAGVRALSASLQEACS